MVRPICCPLLALNVPSDKWPTPPCCCYLIWLSYESQPQHYERGCGTLQYHGVCVGLHVNRKCSIPWRTSDQTLTFIFMKSYTHILRKKLLNQQLHFQACFKDTLPTDTSAFKEKEFYLFAFISSTFFLFLNNHSSIPFVMAHFEGSEKQLSNFSGSDE